LQPRAKRHNVKTAHAGEGSEGRIGTPIVVKLTGEKDFAHTGASAMPESPEKLPLTRNKLKMFVKYADWSLLPFRGVLPNGYWMARFSRIGSFQPCKYGWMRYFLHAMTDVRNAPVRLVDKKPTLMRLSSVHV
jgi:hypothetical protein